MKEKDAFVDYKPHQLILYVEKEDGSYGPMKTGSYITKNYVDNFWEKRRHLEEKCFDMLKKGEISPVGYYMILEDLTDKEMSLRVKVSTSRVKKHRTTRAFGKIRLDLLTRYAEIFNIPMAGFFQLIVAASDKINIKQETTDNPYIIITKIEEKKP